MTASTLHAAAAPPERPIASRAVTSLAAAFLHRSVAGAPDMPPPSPRQLLPAVSSPLFSARAASQADQQCSVAESHRGSRCAARLLAGRSALLQRRRRRLASFGCELAALRAAALALAAAAMMARNEIVGGRESGSRSDRSGGVRRGRYERGDCFGFALRLCPVCHPMMPAQRPLAPGQTEDRVGHP